VDNDRTLEILAETAASQASAGADVIVPSGMIDGMVASIRQGLDRAGFVDTLVCAHSVKMASALYTPFRDAAESAPVEGDRRSLQMDPANAEEAEREAALDESEGADLLLVEPAVACLDIIRRVSVRTRLPVAAFMASGEYAMIKAAGAQGWIDEAAVLWEQHVAIKRAGARVIMTYAAREIAQMIKERG
jgi:porphobilinogen synthase